MKVLPRYRLKRPRLRLRKRLGRVEWVLLAVIVIAVGVTSALAILNPS